MAARLLPVAAAVGMISTVFACAMDANTPATPVAETRSAEPETPIAKPVKLRVEMGDYYFAPAELELKEGQKVLLTLVNQGAEEHELLVGQDIIQVDGNPGGYGQSFLDTASRVLFTGEKFDWEYEGELLELEVMPGGQVTMEFTVPGGKGGVWEMACFVPGHYEAGMRGKLIVSGS